ncbi:hypothetical protein Daesc_005710 [Daldinia eschscholtzii]|uniref:Uncharacterized protein n=1 Tax=Daldinia eschscholtzii TaxID=292717 RepID=A0AAX6MLP4_9PEZI
MQFNSLIAAAMLAMTANAAVVQRQNPNIVQFSAFREGDCSGSASAGMYIVSQSDKDTCKALAPPAACVGSVRSINVEMYDAEGCTLEVYPTPNCSGPSQQISEVACLPIASGLDNFNSYKVSC